jgi:4-hydroxy-3-methylbut-2-enyl diphosphate reductase
MITNQTTLSMLDTADLIKACLERYPDASANPEICTATTMRQKAVMTLNDTDLLVVVGDPHSNNSNQLREIGRKAGIPAALLIETADDLREDLIRGKHRIAVTSGSSTPTPLTDAVIATLEHYAETGEFVIQKQTAPIL